MHYKGSWRGNRFKGLMHKMVIFQDLVTRWVWECLTLWGFCADQEKTRNKARERERGLTSLAPESTVLVCPGLQLHPAFGIH